MRKILIYFLAALIITIISAYVMTSASEPNKFKYLALGDSYTIGESVSEYERFPVQLTARLNSEDVDISPPLVIAKTGWTTDELMSAINEKNVKDTFDIVTLLIGVNNQYRGRSSEQYRGELKQLLETALAYVGGKTERVIVLSIPDWGVTPFAEGRDRNKIGAEIDEYNNVKKEETEKMGIRFYDITPISRGTDPALVATDGLHPSGKQYMLWVDKFYGDVKKVLSK